MIGKAFRVCHVPGGPRAVGGGDWGRQPQGGSFPKGTMMGKLGQYNGTLTWMDMDIEYNLITFDDSIVICDD